MGVSALRLFFWGYDSCVVAYNTAAPKAFLNWAMLDDRFNYVQGGVTQVPVISGSMNKQVLTANLPAVIPKNGYLYIYVSNESPQDVFFDNVTVQHHRGPLLGEDDYYPFGLAMNGINSQAAGKMENLKKFNKGSELQHKEFSDGGGLETYTTQFRMLDPQLGRWWQVDPKPNENESPYSSMGNNPILKDDPLGDTLDFPGASPEFITQVYSAVEYLIINGAGDNVIALMNSPTHVSIYEQEPEDGGDASEDDAAAIYWGPTSGLKTNNGVILSPATLLDHEVNHQVQRISNPSQYEKDSKPDGTKYDNKEEKRVITGSEQKTAQALGEVKKGQLTRTDHRGSYITTSGPTSNKYDQKEAKKKEQNAEQKVIEQIKKKLEKSTPKNTSSQDNKKN